MQFCAHSKEGFPVEQWQPLDEHLRNVAELAAEFAKPFGGEAWAELLGIYHDLGKSTQAWQAWLRRVNEVVDEFSSFYEGHPTHASVGAQWLSRHSSQAGKLLAYCIAGHHGGMPNWNGGSVNSGLKGKLEEPMPDLRHGEIPECPSTLPFMPDSDRMGFQFQFFARMLFSCLVDADYLDTERFMDEKKAAWRARSGSLAMLSERFWSRFSALREQADPELNVNQQRESVLKDCLVAAHQESGLFSLTVPTGGGKTLASLAFALEHAKKHQKRRIIYVIPFTSIIEQNAAVFREMLGEDAVLEHHCNFIPDEADWKIRLASENWDASVVVTTNVQFFNSFYENKPAKCRKLHNVADSVVIFDEVQAIPVEKLKPCLEVIKELSENYGTTSVLCTATQPALEYTDEFTTGLKGVREIVSDVGGLFGALKRTEECFIGELSEQAVSEKLATEKQVLCIVNTRQQALDVFNALPISDDNIHLSALMYPAHRTCQLEEVRRRLLSDEPCRVVSTQLIEAGVDVDFPVVYRAVAGIDSIAQAAGRCNRNGKHEVARPVYIFNFPEDSACSAFRQAAQSTTKLFEGFEGKLTAPECVQAYFADYFWKNEQRMDEQGILEKCAFSATLEIPFREIAEFQMIQSATTPIVIAIEEEAAELVRSLEYAEHSGGILRRLQKYMVQVYPYQLDQMREWLVSPLPELYVLESKELYSQETGLRCRPPQGQSIFG